MDNTVKSLIKRTVLLLLTAKVTLACLWFIVGFPVAFLIKNFIKEADDFLAGFAIVWYTMLFSSFFVHYLNAKMFGLFKLIDKLNWNVFIKILFLILTSVLLFIIFNIGFFGFDSDWTFTLSYLVAFSYGLPFAFFLYKLFQFLTKKYPYPFEKIGYYSSIEFYKKFFKKN